MIDKARQAMIRDLLQTGANHNYVSKLTGVEVKFVERIADGSYVHVHTTPSRIRQAERERELTRRRKYPRGFRPALRRFPELQGKTDRQRILLLAEHGLSASKIARHLMKRHSAKVIQDYARRELGPAVRNVNNSTENRLGVYMTGLITVVMEDAFGKNRFQCELCLDPVPGGCLIHHTKYEGATIYDLMFICGSCNLSRANVGLS